MFRFCPQKSDFEMLLACFASVLATGYFGGTAAETAPVLRCGTSTSTTVTMNWDAVPATDLYYVGIVSSASPGGWLQNAGPQIVGHQQACGQHDPKSVIRDCRPPRFQPARPRVPESVLTGGFLETSFPRFQRLNKRNTARI